MFCSNCGNRINADEKFCNNCGAAQRKTATSAATVTATASNVNGTGKKNGTVTLIIIAAVIVMGIIALVSGSSGVPGKYYFESGKEGSDYYTAEDLEVYGYSPEHFYIELYDDGTGLIYMLGDRMYMVYDDNYIWEDGDEENKQSYTVSNGTLTIEGDGVKMVFKKK